MIHENRRLNPYIRDVVRRLAKAGFIAIGPDGLPSLGGYPGSDEEGRENVRFSCLSGPETPRVASALDLIPTRRTATRHGRSFPFFRSSAPHRVPARKMRRRGHRQS
nr:hypothetical protein [Ruegeria profundi]